MKNVVKISVVLLAILSLVSCASTSGYTVSGKIAGVTSKEAYLVIGEKVDTAVFVEDAFLFEGTVEEPVLGQLIISGQRVYIMVENTAITVEATPEYIQEALVTGGMNQAAYSEFEANAPNPRVNQDDYISFCEEFIAAHSDSYFTPYLISSIAPAFTPQEAMDMIEKLTPEVKTSKVSQDLIKQIKPALAMSPGAQAPEFTMNDVSGKPVKLSDVYGKSKYLLIDFWASWCGPCRKENPNVVANYKKYNAKGFDILGVSLDQKQEAWVEAIEKDELTWLHVSDLKGWKNAAAGLYAVRSIPSNFLIDNTGKIIATNLREEALGQKLSELLD